MALVLMCIGGIGMGIYKLFKPEYYYINTLNNEILEQKTEIININNICETLDLSKIDIDIDIIIIETHLNISIIIILIDIISVILWIYSNKNNLSPLFIIYILYSFIISIMIIFLILYLGNKYNSKSIIKFNNLKKEIINKKDDIDKKYIDNLLILLDTSDDINNINLNIDEYISNYSYLHINLNTKPKDKNILIFELQSKLFQIKNNELIHIMNTKLKTFQEITPEIVKYELDKLNKDLDNYKKHLLLKINAIHELSYINSIIINIS